MSRETKFRAWHKTKQKYYPIVSLNFYAENVCVGKPYNNDWVSFDEVILEQYTGLKDNNGVEIYEGDIVKVHDDWGTYGMMAGEVREVYFAYGGFRFKPKDNINAKGNWLDNGNYCVVIGNIHENKELLK